MRIVFTKISDDRHALEVNGERAELETKSVLLHDFLHFAVEAEAGLQDGFWGLLASGKSLSDMNDRTGRATAGASRNIGRIEQIVGAMSGLAKGRSPADMMAGFRNMALSQGEDLPPWLTEDLIVRARERMRRLVGHWNATPFGGSMEIGWSSRRAANHSGT